MNRVLLIVFFIFSLGALTTSSMASVPEYVYLNGNGMPDNVEDTVLLKKYGQPEHNFTKPRPELKNTPIKEMLWHLSDDLNLTCWLHYKDGKWIVISYVFWPPDALF